MGVTKFLYALLGFCLGVVFAAQLIKLSGACATVAGAVG